MYHLYLYLFIVPKNQCKNMYIGLKQIAGKSMILFHVIWGLCFFLESSLFFELKIHKEKLADLRRIRAKIVRFQELWIDVTTF